MKAQLIANGDEILADHQKTHNDPFSDLIYLKFIPMDGRSQGK